MGKKKTGKILDLLENESTTSDLLPKSNSYLITIWLQITLKAFREYPRGDSLVDYKIIKKKWEKMRVWTPFEVVENWGVLVRFGQRFLCKTC